MAKSITLLPAIALALTGAHDVLSAPHPVQTVVLGPFSGFDAPLSPANTGLAYYGTDLGWSYRHDGRIQFLFGDTLASEKGDTIAPLHDDAFGSIALSAWPNGARIDPAHIPRIVLGQNAGTAQAAALNPGHAMEVLKTPLGGFSNGRQEFAVFLTAKPQGCSTDADCSDDLACDSGLGFVGARYDRDEGLTLPCADGAPGCVADTMVDASGVPIANSGLCVDRSSTIAANNEFGRVGAYGVRQLVGIRSTNDASRYTAPHEWLTNKFFNPALRAVAGRQPRVFVWGRPGFVGVNAKGATLGLYFAYADMPAGEQFAWTLHYYTGTDAKGVARFSSHERDAVPLDLDSTRPGLQTQEAHDLVQQMSVVWIAALHKWVMFYGGGISEFPIPGVAPNCGVLEIFARVECKNVAVGNGAVRMRTADEPWGPWTPPQDVLVGGDAKARPLGDQYAPGGVLHHPDCHEPACVRPSAHMLAGDYGWLYGANIIEEWTAPAGKGVDVIWNASTWDPYRVILLKTRIEP